MICTTARPTGKATSFVSASGLKELDVLAGTSVLEVREIQRGDGDRPDRRIADQDPGRFGDQLCPRFLASGAARPAGVSACAC